MKFKFILAALAAGIIFGAAASAAEITGTVLTTDIGAVIDGAPIESYNVNDSTYVIAEDLSGYGFDVAYSDSNRALYIEQNVYAERTLMSEEEINKSKSKITVGEWVADIYSSDITVQLNGVPIEAYSLDGQMIIPVRALENCAYVEFDEKRRVARVYGLRWYMEQLYLNGEAEMEVEEYTARAYEKKNYNTLRDEEISVTEITASADKGGKISLYIGNPVVEWSGGQYVGANEIIKEQYVITNENGKEIYRVHLQSDGVGSYIWLPGHCQEYGSYKSSMLYGREVDFDNEFYDYWPSDEEVAASDMTIKQIDAIGTNTCVLTNSGYILKLSTTDERTLMRYNVKSIVHDKYYYYTTGSYMISNDDTLYKYNSLVSSKPSVGSSFDEKISENVLKFDEANKYWIDTDGRFYNYHDKLLLENAAAFDIRVTNSGSEESFIAALTDTGELYIGTDEDYLNGTVGVAAHYVKSIYFGNDVLYFINENNELYSYSVSTWSAEKLADNIAEIVDAGYYVTQTGYYITTDGKLTTLSRVIADGVSTAYANSKYIYAVHSDGTVYRYIRGGSEAERMYY